MSVLDNDPQQTESEKIALGLKVSTKRIFQGMVNAFNVGSMSFWNNPRATPSEIATALGTDAKEIFQLHYALGQLISNIKPKSIEQGLSLIGQFNINEDGTVTILPPSGNP